MKTRTLYHPIASHPTIVGTEVAYLRKVAEAKSIDQLAHTLKNLEKFGFQLIGSTGELHSPKVAAAVVVNRASPIFITRNGNLRKKYSELLKAEREGVPKTKLVEVPVHGCGCGACNRYGFHMEVQRVPA